MRPPFLWLVCFGYAVLYMRRMERAMCVGRILNFPGAPYVARPTLGM